LKIIAATLAALLAASAANAVIVTGAFGAPDPGPGPGKFIAVDFTNPNAAGFVWTAGTISTSITTNATAAAPALDTTRYGYVTSALPNNFATLSTPNLKTISFYWGSIDTFNSLDVLGAGGVVIHTIGGASLPPANGNRTSSNTNRRIFITAGPNEVITGLTFRSTGVAFEFDDIATSVPEPQAWAMLIAGFGLVGAVARRQRRPVQVAA
jgi:PEP-CTERM motif